MSARPLVVTVDSTRGQIACTLAQLIETDSPAARLLSRQTLALALLHFDFCACGDPKDENVSPFFCPECIAKLPPMLRVELAQTASSHEFLRGYRAAYRILQHHGRVAQEDHDA